MTFSIMNAKNDEATPTPRIRNAPERSSSLSFSSFLVDFFCSLMHLSTLVRNISWTLKSITRISGNSNSLEIKRIEMNSIKKRDERIQINTVSQTSGCICLLFVGLIQILEFAQGLVMKGCSDISRQLLQSLF